MIRTVIFAVAHACGGSVGGTLAVMTFVLRLAALKPELDRLQRRFEKDPLMFASVAIQLPLVGGLYSLNHLVRAGLGLGRRFLWIVDLGRPDGWIALAAAGLVGVSALLARAGSAPNAATMILVLAMLAVVSTLVFVVNAPAATAVSVAAGTVSGVVQGWVAKRGLRGAGRTTRRVGYKTRNGAARVNSATPLQAVNLDPPTVLVVCLELAI